MKTLWVQFREYSIIETLQSQNRFKISKAVDLRCSANIHHTQLTLITLKRQPHKDLVNCQPVYVGAKASLSIISDRAFDYFWTSISRLYILSLLPLAKKAKSLTLIAVCKMKAGFLLDLISYECSPSCPSLQPSCRPFWPGLGIT